LRARAHAESGARLRAPKSARGARTRRMGRDPLRRWRRVSAREGAGGALGRDESLNQGHGRRGAAINAASASIGERHRPGGPPLIGDRHRVGTTMELGQPSTRGRHGPSRALRARLACAKTRTRLRIRAGRADATRANAKFMTWTQWVGLGRDGWTSAHRHDSEALCLPPAIEPPY